MTPANCKARVVCMRTGFLPEREKRHARHTTRLRQVTVQVAERHDAAGCGDACGRREEAGGRESIASCLVALLLQRGCRRAHRRAAGAKARGAEDERAQRRTAALRSGGARAQPWRPRPPRDARARGTCALTRGSGMGAPAGLHCTETLLWLKPVIKSKDATLRLLALLGQVVSSTQLAEGRDCGIFC